LARPGVEIAPRKQWPSGMAELGVPVSGRIGADELAEPGRVIGRLSDIGWGTRLRELVGSAQEPDAADVPVPKDVLDACVRVLAGWGWTQRPVGVVAVGSRTRPHQVAQLARRIAEIGRLPLLGTLHPIGDRPDTHANSAQRLGAVWGGLAEPDFALPAGPVLLVDDVIDSGWTLTVAARMLRRAGAAAVLPFALAQNG
jgi:ATP-dependent DNA helicase RecQ